MQDEYKIEPIKDFENYKIDTNGAVYGLYGKRINGSVTYEGYLRVGLYKNGNRYNMMIHRLVARQFLDMTDTDIVKHRNGNIKDNNLGNLTVVHTDYGSSLVSSDKSGKYVRAVNSDESLYFQSIKKAGEFIRKIGKSSSEKVASGNIRRSLKIGCNAYGFCWKFANIDCDIQR